MEKTSVKKSETQGVTRPVPNREWPRGGGHKRSLRDTSRRPGVRRLIPASGALQGWTLISLATRGIYMEKLEQTQVEPKKNEEANDSDPFKRRDSLKRTPPLDRDQEASGGGEEFPSEEFSNITDILAENPTRSRSTSVPDFDSDIAKKLVEESEEIEQHQKRKRADITPDKDRKDNKRSGEVFKKHLERLFKQINLLNVVVKGAYKPKKEICDISRTMSLCARELQNEEFKTWLDEATDCIENAGMQAKKSCPEKQVESMPKREMSTIGTQVTESELEKELEISKNVMIATIKDTLREDKGFNEISQVLKEAWPEEVFKCTKIDDTNVSSLNKEGDIAVIVDPQNLKMDKTMGTLELILPELANLIKESDDKVDFILNSTKTINKNKEESEKVRAVYTVPWGTIDEETKSLEKLYTQVRSLKDAMEIHPTSSIHVVINGGMQNENPRKIFEYVFGGSNMDVIMMGTIPKEPTKRTFRPGPERMVVKCEGKSYADMLRDIKNKVNVNNMGLNIRNIKKTAKGDLMFELEGGKNEANILKDEIQKKVNATEIRVHKQETLIHINDLDAITQAEEILESIARVIGPENKKFVTVKSLRPNRNGGQAATVAVQGKDLAKRITHDGRIKIGWINCRLRERYSFMRCYRCLEYGHHTKECKGEDKANLCRNCGKESHKASDCKENPYCLTCKIEGHRNDQIKCPAFRALIEEKSAGVNKRRGPMAKSN
ncbi:unnamed protein product [Psylliodes chrysocephalus]|uniref:CCHC-type domain-containing protein n=1 Tax=Psylliodes chrysocephalus TaxID=3402493 RepID=A0A9P0D421_9CUCU|nr:unnamed protein product [Psylliodes chrysocephala]